MFIFIGALDSAVIAFNKYLLLTEFEGYTVSYGLSFFLRDLWPKCEVREP